MNIFNYIKNKFKYAHIPNREYAHRYELGFIAEGGGLTRKGKCHDRVLDIFDQLYKGGHYSFSSYPHTKNFNKEADDLFLFLFKSYAEDFTVEYANTPNASWYASVKYKGWEYSNDRPDLTANILYIQNQERLSKSLKTFLNKVEYMGYMIGQMQKYKNNNDHLKTYYNYD